MNKKQIGITLGIMCLILTFGVTLQIRTMNSASSTASQTLADNELRDSVLKWKEKYDNISEELKRAEKVLEGVRQTMLGLTDVKGSGIVIELQDGKLDNSFLTIAEPSKVLVHYEDLLSLVNELRNSGAEAIQINGQRIVNTSAITCEGTVIKINGERIGSPFTIKAIGSQALLYGQITREGSYLNTMKDTGVDVVSVTQEDEITIEKYTGTMNFKYIKSVK